jgi:hypothetical protein
MTITAAGLRLAHHGSHREQPSPPEILVHAVLSGERRLDGLLGFPRPDHITRIPSLSRRTSHPRSLIVRGWFRRLGSGGVIMAFIPDENGFWHCLDVKTGKALAKQ